MYYSALLRPEQAAAAKAHALWMCRRFRSLKLVDLRFIYVSARRAPLPVGPAPARRRGHVPPVRRSVGRRLLVCLQGQSTEPNILPIYSKERCDQNFRAPCARGRPCPAGDEVRRQLFAAEEVNRTRLDR